MGGAPRRVRVRGHRQYRGGARGRGAADRRGHAESPCGDIAITIARSGEVIASYKLGGLGDAMLVLGPEHVRTMAGDGWSKADVRRFVWEHTQASVEGTRVAKFRQPDNIKIIVAGGTAGRFSAWIPG